MTGVSGKSAVGGPAARANKMASHRIGLGLSGIVVASLIADALVQIFAPALLRADMDLAGFPLVMSPVSGSILFLAVALYAVPRTSVLGAVVLTGFLGGAIAIHLRIGETSSLPQLICLLLGVAAWGGLYLRDARLRQLLPVVAS